MGKKTVKIIEAQKNKKLILETVIGNDQRIGIPKTAQNIFDTSDKVKVTIEKPLR